MPRDIVQLIKWESTAGGGTENDEVPTGIDPQEDNIECAGAYLQDADHRDRNVLMDRVGDDMILKDTNNPDGVTLTDLRFGGIPDVSKVILDLAGTMVYVGDGDIVLKV